MKTRAAVAFEAGKQLEIVDVELAGPKAGEVLVEIKATGVCHTDAFTMGVELGSTVAVFGSGGIGLNVIQGARMVGAARIIGVDMNPAKAALAGKFGMTDFVDPSEVE